MNLTLVLNTQSTHESNTQGHYHAESLRAVYSVAIYKPQSQLVKPLSYLVGLQSPLLGAAVVLYMIPRAGSQSSWHCQLCELSSGLPDTQDRKYFPWRKRQREQTFGGKQEVNCLTQETPHGAVQAP